VVLPIPPERAASWQRAHDADDILVVGDADRRLYRALGVGRGGARDLLLDRASWRAAIDETLRGNIAMKHRGDDGFQLGADLVLDDEARVVRLHRPRTAADRLAPEALLDALP
jgi:hypothetical protein